MAILGGLDVHRSQITYDYLDSDTGEVSRGRIQPADRDHLRAWLKRFQGRDATFALEATTGWRYVIEELHAAGLQARLADPAETSARRGPKRRAKTDRQDAQHLRHLLVTGLLPECWIPPEHILELRNRVRLRKDLVDDRTAWQQRIHAQLFHHGVTRPTRLLGRGGRSRLEALDISPSARQTIDVGLRVIDALNVEIEPVERYLNSYARRQPGCRALMTIYGIGSLIATAIVAELGDASRFASSADVVRYAGLDVTVYSSDGKRAPGHLSRQGPGVLRWAFYEAAQCAARANSPDRAYYLDAKDRIDHNRACLSVARKLARRSYHVLKGLGDDVLRPVDDAVEAAA